MNTVVYYPHFTPPSSWLKMAALCWERVYRLLPEDAPSDPPDVAELDAELGGVLSAVPWEQVADRQQVKESFKDWVADRAEEFDRGHRTPTHPEEHALMRVGLYESKFPGGELVEFLVERGLATLRTTTATVEIPSWEKASWDSSLVETQSFHVEPRPGSDHYEFNRLKQLSWDRSLAGDAAGATKAATEAETIRRRNLISVEDHHSVVELPRDVALHYVSLCASEAAVSGNRDLVGASEAFTDAIFHRHRLTGELAVSILHAVLPVNINVVEAQRIRDLRIELAQSRLLYQRDVEALAAEFSTVASEGELAQLKTRVVDLAEQKVADTRRSYRRARLAFVERGLAVSVTPPAAATWLASTLGIGLFVPVALAGAVALVGSKLVLDWAEARSQRAQAPWSYVLELQARF